MSAEQSGLLASSRSLLAAGLDLIKTRIELILVEAEEEKARLAAILWQGLVATLFLGFGALFLAVFITVLLWDSNRLLALGCISAVFLTIGSLAFLAARRESQRGSRLFAASLAELRHDLAELEGRRDAQ